jgi:acetyl-CoA carboxylase biotin carboxyl carrier protein
MAQGAEKRGSKRTAAAAAARAEQNGGGEDAIAAVNMTDLAYVRGLIEAVDRSGIDRLDIARAGTRIRIAKTPAGPSFMTLPTGPVAPPSVAHAAPVHVGHAAPQAAASQQAAQPAAETRAASNLLEVKSPMVGTYYRAPAPDAPPYVEVGTSVTKGQTLCILEAMKLMNELESEFDGIVREILVEDADPVEYGQVLFRIEPAK